MNVPHILLHDFEKKTGDCFVEQIICTESACEWEYSSQIECHCTEHTSFPKSLWVLKHEYCTATKTKDAYERTNVFIILWFWALMEVLFF